MHFIFAVELYVAVNFSFDIFYRAGLVDGADVADVLDAHRNVVINKFAVIGINFFACPACRIDDGVGDFAAAQFMHGIPVGVYLPRRRVFVGRDDLRLRGDAAGERRDVLRLHIANDSIVDFYGVALVAFCLAIGCGINVEGRTGLSFGDNHPLDLPGDIGISRVGCAVFDAHIHTDVLFQRLAAVDTDDVIGTLPFVDSRSPTQADARCIGGRRREETAVITAVFRHDGRSEVADRAFVVSELVFIDGFGA